MKNTLNNKNYTNIYIYQYFGQTFCQADRPPTIDEIIILYVYTKCLIKDSCKKAVIKTSAGV